MFEKLLNREGSELVSKIQANIRSAGKEATGKTARSLRNTVVSTDDFVKLTIDAAPWFFTLEEGRGPTKNSAKGDPTLFSKIVEWANAKGIIINAWAATKKIHEKGTKLFRQGGRKDIFSNVINDNTVKSIEDKIAEISLKATADSIVKTYEKGN